MADSTQSWALALGFDSTGFVVDCIVVRLDNFGEVNNTQIFQIKGHNP